MMLGHDYPATLAPFAKVLDAFGPGLHRGAYWYALCPAHDDTHPSLAVWLGEGGLTLVFGCHAGCRKLDILKAAGLQWRDLYLDAGEQERWRPKVVATYDYRDESGKLLYQKVRLEPGKNGRRKDFYCRQPDPADAFKWLNHLSGVRRVLYRLPELLAAPSDRTVLCPEGEKDVETARRLGFVATCNVDGCRGEWRDDYSEALSGRHVVTIPDPDGGGRRHAAEVAGSLLMHEVASLRVAGLPRKDLTDYVTALREAGVRDLRGAVAKVLGDARQWRPARKVVTCGG